MQWTIKKNIGAHLYSCFSLKEGKLYAFKSEPTTNTFLSVENNT